MDNITYKKIEYILSGSKILPEEINELIDLIDAYAEAAYKGGMRIGSVSGMRVSRGGELNVIDFHTWLLKKDLPIVSKDEPKLIGFLNKKFGFVGFNNVKIGTEVFEYKDNYQFTIIPLNGTVPSIQKFKKETLRPCIDFIENL